MAARPALGRLCLLLLALSTLLLAVACTGDRDAQTAASGSDARLSGSLTVFAAASLTDSFTQIAGAFEAKNPGVDVEFNFAGSSALRAQLDQGARADVFASADTVQMDQAIEEGLIAGASNVFAHNSLVLITPRDNPAGIESLAGLKKPGLMLVLAAPQVPVGNYARQMLANADKDPAYGAGFSDAVLRNLVSNEATVKDIVAKVQLGEADAGIVYGTDVTPSVAANLTKIDIPQSINVLADYAIAVTKDAANPRAAAAFVDFVMSKDGQAILEQWGFRAAG